VRPNLNISTVEKEDNEENKTLLEENLTLRSKLKELIESTKAK
jgi:hypothetical protein